MFLSYQYWKDISLHSNLVGFFITIKDTFQKSLHENYFFEAKCNDIKIDYRNSYYPHSNRTRHEIFFIVFNIP